tara:strand:+ start:321 stop:734 length:414 start_codon:yes stop_codon:yes gene_type:complete
MPKNVPVPTTIASIVKENPHSDLGVTLVQRQGKLNATAIGVLCGQLCFSRELHVVVAAVRTGSPADEAGVAAGDEIKSINGEAAESAIEAKTALEQANHGAVQLELVKGAFAGTFFGTEYGEGSAKSASVAVGVPVA